MLIPFLIPFLIAIFLAINMGGSGTAPSFSAAYGANIIKKNLIPGLFGIAVFAGAILGGKETAKTVGSGLLDPDCMTFTVVSIILFAVAISLLVANLFGIPQSTSQSTVLAVVAPAIYFHNLNSDKLLYEILPTWFVMPIASFILALLIGKYIYKPLRKQRILALKKSENDSYLSWLVILMSIYVAFSIGTNNVANAVGPLAVMAMNELGTSPEQNTHVMILATLIIAPSFGIGSSFFGNKVVKRTGKEIVIFGKVEAVIIAFISASLLLTASLIKGIPTSLVQLNVGAILGIGVAKFGFQHIFRRTEVNQFFIMWLIAPAIAFSISLLLIWLADINGLIYLY